MKNLYLIIGESGTGKDMVVDELCKIFNTTKVISYTTRPKRYHNENTHIFINQEEAKELKNIVAETYFAGNYYCATQEQMDKSGFYIIDKKGIEYFIDHYNSERKYHIVYITAPPLIRRLRMTQRGDKSSNVDNRLANDDEAFAGVDSMCDFMIDNIELDDTIRQIAEFINQCEK